MFSTKDLEAYVTKSTSALELKFVRSQDDVFDDSLTFAPRYTHQVFGEREVLFGYKNLKIKLYYIPDTLDTYIGLTYDDVIDPTKHDGTKPDNVVKRLSEYIPQGFSTNLDEYIVRISKPRKFLPFGELLRAYRREDITYEVYKADISCPGLIDYHERMQTFLLWFIDASSFIDIDDDKWTFYIIFRKQRVNEGVLFSLVGYTSIYSFFAYPDKIRPRLSQMLILPPFQRKGHGAELLQAIYDDLVPCPRVLDITVEDPSEEFRALRDFVDCRNATKLSCFKPPAIHKSYAESAEKECRSKLKLQKKQALRVYEILRLRATDRSNSEHYRDYRIAVKNRINGPFQKEQKDLIRLQKLIDPSELALTHPQTSPDDRATHLHQAYKELEEEYMTVIEKLAASPET